MIVHELSQFLVKLEYDDIPKKSIEKVKLCLIDYLAVYLRGLKTENSKIMIKTLNGFNNSFNLSNDFNYNQLDDLINNLNKFDVLNKGLINGIASHSLDLDDGHRLAQLHPGSIVFSTVLALSSNSLFDEVTCKEFFESVVCGYEIGIVLGILLNPKHRNQGFHSTGTIGTFAAGAVAAKLLKLDLSQIEHCFGLCATQAAGLLEADHAGTMGKTLHVGKAVYNGLLSAFLAKNGFTGGESIVDGDEGLINSLVVDFDWDNFNNSNNLNNGFSKDSVDVQDVSNKCGLDDSVDVQDVSNKCGLDDSVDVQDVSNKCGLDDSVDVQGVSNNYELNLKQFLNENLAKFHINEVYFKKFPFCRHIHSAIDSTLVLKEVLKSLDKDFNCIDEIVIETYKIASEHDNFNPGNIQGLKQSLPYAVAIALISDDLSLDSIDDLINQGLLDFNSLVNNREENNYNNYNDSFNGDDSCVYSDVEKINSIINKVTIVNDDYLNSLTPNKRPSKVSFKLDSSVKFSSDSKLGNFGYVSGNHSILESTTLYPLGEAENPLYLDDLIDKFELLNPDFDLNRLKFIKDMENSSLKEVFKKIGLIK